MSETATPIETPPPSTVRTWREALRLYLQPASLRMVALGFAAGLPLLLVLGTLSFRLREAGIDRSTIGYLSWVGLAYGVKWMWAPLVDRMPIPWLTRQLGRRRSWLLLSQIVIAGGLVGMALNDPSQLLGPLVACALAVAVASATQDIALDAFRIESADVRHQGALAATYQTGYRLAMIWAGAGVLWLAARAEVAPTVAAGAVAPGARAVVAAVLLGVADRIGAKQRPLAQLTWGHGLLFGLAQALALIPGVSRSGGTITAGLLMGYTREAAARYSFLLAVPAVMASGFYQLYRSWAIGSPIPPGPTALATLIAFGVGYGVIVWFLKLVSTRGYMPFVWYRIGLGVLVFALLGAGVLSAT